MRELGARGPLVAAIGPGAGRAATRWATRCAGRSATHGGRTVDLKAVAARRLAAPGVDAIHDVGRLHDLRPERFFCHRRDGGGTGRQAGVAWLS